MKQYIASICDNCGGVRFQFQVWARNHSEAETTATTIKNANPNYPAGYITVSEVY